MHNHNLCRESLTKSQAKFSGEGQKLSPLKVAFRRISTLLNSVPPNQGFYIKSFIISGLNHF